MYQWYESSEVCYAYLADVWYNIPCPADDDRVNRTLCKSRQNIGERGNEAASLDKALAANMSPAESVKFEASRWSQEDGLYKSS